MVTHVENPFQFVSLIDKCLPPDKQTNVTSGEAVASMVLNGLGFSNRVTTLTPQFFSTKPMDLLIGKDITEEQLNRHKLGRTLDKIAAYGCEKLFLEKKLILEKHKMIQQLFLLKALMRIKKKVLIWSIMVPNSDG